MERTWQEWEKKLVREKAGTILASELLAIINDRRQSEGLPLRTINALRVKAIKLNCSVSTMYSDRQTLHGWAQTLGLSWKNLNDAYHRYAKTVCQVLKKRRSKERLMISSYVMDQVLEWRDSLAAKVGAQHLRLVGLERAAIAAERYQKSSRIYRVPDHLCRRVECIDTGVVYRSAYEAAKANSTCLPHIRRAILEQGTCSGYRWRYLDPPREIDMPRPVRNSEHRWYPNVKAAAEATGQNFEYISSAIKYGWEMNGVTWEFVERQAVGDRLCPVRRLTDDTMFDSVAGASIATGISEAQIEFNIEFNKEWEYVDVRQCKRHGSGFKKGSRRNSIESSYGASRTQEGSARVEALSIA